MRAQTIRETNSALIVVRAVSPPPIETVKNEKGSIEFADILHTHRTVIARARSATPHEGIVERIDEYSTKSIDGLDAKTYDCAVMTAQSGTQLTPRAIGRSNGPARSEQWFQREQRGRRPDGSTVTAGRTRPIGVVPLGTVLYGPLRWRELNAPRLWAARRHDNGRRSGRNFGRGEVAPRPGRRRNRGLRTDRRGRRRPRLRRPGARAGPARRRLPARRPQEAEGARHPPVGGFSGSPVSQRTTGDAPTQRWKVALTPVALHRGYRIITAKSGLALTDVPRGRREDHPAGGARDRPMATRCGPSPRAATGSSSATPRRAGSSPSPRPLRTRVPTPSPGRSSGRRTKTGPCAASADERRPPGRRRPPERSRTT